MNRSLLLLCLGAFALAAACARQQEAGGTGPAGDQTTAPEEGTYGTEPTTPGAPGETMPPPEEPSSTMPPGTTEPGTTTPGTTPDDTTGTSPDSTQDQNPSGGATPPQ